LDCPAGSGACKKHETIIGKRQSVYCWAIFAVFVKPAVETIFSRLFRVCGLEKTDNGVVEPNHDLIFLGTDGHAAAPR
jgi:hypothetical protein